MSTKKLQILGGINASTLGGKTADEFAAAYDFEQLKAQVESGGGGSTSGELITVDDIDTICGTTIQYATNQSGEF